MTRNRVVFQGISPMSHVGEEIGQSDAIPLPGETEASSAGKQTAARYSRLRCATVVPASGIQGNGRFGAMPP